MPIYEGAINDRIIVVLDIGSAYTKIGFSGEYAPRNIIPTEVRCKRTNQIRKVCAYTDKNDLYDLLVDFINMIYFKYVLLSPKDRPLILVESLLCPTLFRETLAKVLFVHYEISTLTILPSHLVSLSALAIDTALVIDVGYSEATVIPVCYGLPVIHAWQALPIGAAAIHSNIKTLLSEDNMGIQNISEEVLEDIKVRCCFVTTHERSEEFTKPRPVICECPDVEYPLAGSRTLKISGKLRETAHEVLYSEDNDHLCLSTMILDSILKVNVDLRAALAENILLIGGSVMAAGFKARLRDELYKQLKSKRYSQLKINKFKFHSPPSKDNYTAWLGGGIYGCTDLVVIKALTFEQYSKEKRLPDWPNMRDNNRAF